MRAIAMVSILLLSQTENSLRGDLEKAGSRVTEYRYPLSGTDLENMYRDTSWDFCIAEITGKNMAIMESIVSRMNRKGKVIVVADSLSVALTDKLVMLGITDLYLKDDTVALLKYILSETCREQNSYGSIVLFDDNEALSGMASSIISRFSFTPVLSDNQNDFLESLEIPDVQFILINLDAADLEISSIIKGTYSHPSLQRNPVIVYTGSATGPDVSDLLSGLNRLTRFILSSEELLSFLLDLLYKKEIMPLVEQVNRLVRFEANECCVRDPLRLIYYTKMESIFECENILGCPDYGQLQDVIQRIMDIMDRVHGIRWLRKETACVDDFNTEGRAG